MNQRTRQNGFIRLIIILVVVLIVLGYFGFNVQNIINTPAVNANLNYAWGLVLDVWNGFLVAPVTFIWDKIIVGILWQDLQTLISKAHVTGQ